MVWQPFEFLISKPSFSTTKLKLTTNTWFAVTPSSCGAKFRHTSATLWQSTCGETLRTIPSTRTFQTSKVQPDGQWPSPHPNQSEFSFRFVNLFFLISRPRPTVAKQNFEIRVIDEFVLLGNSGIMRCSLPSFVTDFIQVNSWLIIDNDESTEINVSQDNFGKLSWCHELIHILPSPKSHTIMSNLFYCFPSQLSSNTSKLRSMTCSSCEETPRFSNAIYRRSWVITWTCWSGLALKTRHTSTAMTNRVRRHVWSRFSRIPPTFIPFTFFHSVSRPWVVSNPIFLMFLVVSHHYSVNVMDEHVLKGNTGIFQCHIPSFVSDFVTIDAWIDDENGDEFRSNAGETLGTFF